MSTVCLLFSAYITTICAIKLIKAGQKIQCFCYSQIVKRALGKKGELMLNIMVSLSQFSFTVTFNSFMAQTSMDVFTSIFLGAKQGDTSYEKMDLAFGDLRNVWTYGLVFIIVSSCLVMVRNISCFSFTFILGNILILLSVIIICIYSAHNLVSNGLGSGIILVNTGNISVLLSTVGYFIFIFEGIGVIMPIM